MMLAPQMKVSSGHRRDFLPSKGAKKKENKEKKRAWRQDAFE